MHPLCGCMSTAFVVQMIGLKLCIYNNCIVYIYNMIYIYIYQLYSLMD